MALDPLKTPERAAQIRQSYLTHPGETPEVDYKSALAFKADDDFALSLARHILGMANAGGGAVVIGFKEDHTKKPQPDPSMADAVTASYDASLLASYVEKHIRGTDKISLRIYKEAQAGQIYPIVEVDGFQRNPFFCNSTKKDSAGKEALKEGALYVRISSARTVELAGPAEWEQLIALCVSRRQDEFLSRFIVLLDQIGFSRGLTLHTSRPVPRERLEDLVVDSAKVVQEELARQKLHRAYFEVAHIPVEEHRWTRDKLREAAERSELRRTGWPIGVVLHNELRPRATKAGIEANVPSEGRGTFDYWRLEEDGAFYFARTLQEDGLDKVRPGEILWIDTRLWRIAEAFEHAAALYRELGVSPSGRMFIRIRHTGLKARRLTTSDPGRYLPGRRVSREDEAIWAGEATQDQIRTQLKELVREVANELTVIFDFFMIPKVATDQILDEYLQSRV